MGGGGAMDSSYLCNGIISMIPLTWGKNVTPLPMSVYVVGVATKFFLYDKICVTSIRDGCNADVYGFMQRRCSGGG